MISQKPVYLNYLNWAVISLSWHVIRLLQKLCVLLNKTIFLSEKKVLGVIRHTTESIHQYTKTNEVGVLATQGTVLSESYKIEITKFHPEIKVYQHACPLWVPLVERNEVTGTITGEIIKKDIE